LSSLEVIVSNVGGRSKEETQMGSKIYDVAKNGRSRAHV
jgi:hypothetical protein